MKRIALSLSGLSALLGLGFWALPAWSAQLEAGPMVGDTQARQAVIWAQTDVPAQIQARYWPESAPESASLSTQGQTLDSSYLTGTVVLKSLKPGTRYRYQLLIDGQALEARPEWSFSTAPVFGAEQQDLPELRLLVGSCFYLDDPLLQSLNVSYGSGMAIFDQMVKTGGDAMLWLGDNIYLAPFDLSSRYNMNQRYIKHRMAPEIKQLLSSMPQFAIWDDHDFGPNNSNTTFWRKEDSLTLFQLYWPNQQYGLPQTPGVFFSRHWGDVDLIATDGRYYRSPNDDPAPARAYFGRTQLDWIKEQLLRSQATFKLVMLGSPLMQRHYDESFIQAEDEYKELMDFLAQKQISGVLFLSGDRHHTLLMKQERPGSYPIYDFTSSPLTSNPTKLLEAEEAKEPLPGTLVLERNFGRIRVTGKRGERQLHLETFDAKGKLLWERTLTQQELGG